MKLALNTDCCTQMWELAAKVLLVVLAAMKLSALLAEHFHEVSDSEYGSSS